MRGLAGLDDVAAFNAEAWDRLAEAGNEWTVPVGPEVIARARQGALNLLLTPTRPVPAAWLGDVRGKRVLALASGGGQQGPCLAAAGAIVTVADMSTAQLERDRDVAAREGLDLTTVQCDMRDLSMFADGSFDIVFNPCSNCFVPEVRPVWREAWRVLVRYGTLLAGFANPVVFMTDLAREAEGVVELKFQQPFSALEHKDDAQVMAALEAGEPLEFGHTLEDQIGGQIDAGFVITGLYEDGWPTQGSPLHQLMKAFMATRALKVMPLAGEGGRS